MDIPKRIFTFCVYGTQPKYCQGMVRNLEYITTHFPEFEVWIDIGADVPASYKATYSSFPRVRLFEHAIANGRLMSYRFFHIDDPDVELMLVRDADSRIGPRDIWCIQQFLASDKKIFTIRDHIYHGMPIMGGQWGMRKIPGFNMRTAYVTFYKGSVPSAAYSSDQNFIAQAVYRPFISHFIAYTSSITLPGECAVPIDCPRASDTDFCGNVILFAADGSEYPEFTYSA